jgi:hypothetical protein
MSRTKNLVNLLDACEKHEFDEIVKAYLKHEFGFQKVIFTDGVRDGGLDVQVFDYKGQKVQFQLTTQKSKTTPELRGFEKKLKEDLEKAELNLTKYKYSSKLFFFYSKSLVGDKIKEYERLAFKEYSINLEIIDANRIAQDAERIIEIQKQLYHSSKLEDFHIQSTTFDDPQENLVFDLISFGQASEFKIQIIEAFILQSFFANENLTTDDVKVLCEKKFKVKEGYPFYEKILHQLRSNHRITKKENKTYSLSDEEKEKVQIKNQQYSLDEKLFVNEIGNILKHYGQDKYIDEYILELKKLYTDNFNSDLEAVINDSDPDKLNRITKDFFRFTEGRLGNKDNQVPLAKDLLGCCLENKFIQKIVASKIYCNNINNDKLEKYLTTKKKFFLDTQIAIYAICCYYKKTSNFDSYYFRTTNELLEFSRREGINFYISERYIWEVQSHIKEAVRIAPFTRIAGFSKLGPSRNVFFNFYKHLNANDEFDTETSFEEFLRHFGFDEHSSRLSMNSKIESFLSPLGIHKEVNAKGYDITETKRIFKRQLMRNNKFKISFTLENDCIMIEFLADKDTDVHPLQPVFLTWDKTFFDVQSEYNRTYPNAQKWITIQPGKLIDVYAILKFSINTETVTENLLALISDELITNTHTLVDAITTILSPTDEVGLQYANKLAEIRETEIDKINKNQIVPPDNIEGEAVIDDVFYQLTQYYQSDENYKLNSLKQLFLKKEYVEIIIDTLLKAVDNFYKTRAVGDQLYSTFDKLISKVEKEDASISPSDVKK